MLSKCSNGGHIEWIVHFYATHTVCTRHTIIHIKLVIYPSHPFFLTSFVLNNTVCFKYRFQESFLRTCCRWSHGRRSKKALSYQLLSGFLAKGLFPELHASRRPRWSRGNVLASRSKVRGFKSGWGPWIFSGRKNPEHKSSGRDFKLEVPRSRVWDFRLVKEPQAWKNRPLRKI